MRVYIAGPMSGRPQFNFPAFDAAAKKLRDMGWQVVNPAELDSPEMRAACLASRNGALGDTPMTWGECLSRDVRIVAEDVEGVVLLPDWDLSRGATLEVCTALLTGKVFFDLRYDLPTLLEPVFVATLVNIHLLKRCRQ